MSKACVVDRRAEFSEAVQSALSESQQFDGQYKLQVLALYLDTTSRIKHRDIRTMLMVIVFVTALVLALMGLHIRVLP